MIQVSKDNWTLKVEWLGYGLDGEVIEVSPPQLKIVKPTMEGFMDYLTNKE